MLHEEKAYPSLREHLSSCRPAMSFGLSPNARRVIIVAYPEEWDAARDYVARWCPKATITGFFPIEKDSCWGQPLTSIPDVTNTCDVPLLAQTDVPNYPEAAVLVFCSVPNSKISFSLLFYTLQVVGHVFVYPEISDDLWSTRPLPDFFNTNKGDLEWVYARLADTESKVAFAAAVKAAITGNIGYIRLPDFKHYRHPLTWPKEGDIVIDAGIGPGIGESVRFARAVGSSGRVYSFEPDPVLFASAQAQLAQRPEKETVTLVPAGLFSGKADMQVSISTTGGGHLTNNQEEEARSCQVIDLDSFVKEQNLPRVDVIKMDIEGSEGPALAGMAHCLREYKPRLMISTYHNGLQDMTTLPRVLLGIRPDYQIRFATSYMFCGEFVYYAS
ncbi:hypothetical protein FACS189475_05980 [Betaproteobacteria bacterium]|nr:hypothetical protein FACS189475_05980 [Betaproteobacteria bacterium]